MEKTLAESLDESATELDFDVTDVKRARISSSSNSIPEDTLIQLPTEAVEHVFSFMSLRERNDASLVCTKWNEIANYYWKNEKLVFRGYQNFETYLSLLSNTKRNYLNLEFHHCDFHIPSNLLSLREKIRSLRFRNCTFSVPFQIELFQKCDHLNEFYYKTTNGFDRLERNNCGLFRGTVEALVEQQFVNRNLKSLRVCTDVDSITDENFKSLFHLFPNIKHLTFGQGGAFILGPSLPSEILSMEHELESLKISLSSPYLPLLMVQGFGFKRFFFVLSLELDFYFHCYNAKIRFRLKKISLRIHDANEDDNLSFDFISHLEYLEEISLKIDGCGFDHSLLSRFIRLLDSKCLHLKHLKLHIRKPRCGHDLRPQVFEALVSSKLVSFNVGVELYAGTSDFYQMFRRNSITNKTLRILRIPGWVSNWTMAILLRSFENLKVLEFRCSYTVVTKLIRFLSKDFTTLKLCVCVSNPLTRPGYGVVEPPLSELSGDLKNCLSSLTSLEYLELTVKCGSDFTYESIPASVKYLRLSFPEGSDHGLHHLKKVSGLETIYIMSNTSSTIDLCTWTEICNSLEKLRVLYLESSVDYKLETHDTYPFSETHQQLFECCPSLRLLVQKTSNRFQVFHFDHVDKIMKKVNGLSYLSVKDLLDFDFRKSSGKISYF